MDPTGIVTRRRLTNVDQQQSELVARAREAARSLQRTARVVEYLAVAALVLLVIFLLTDTYDWRAFTGLTLTVIVGVQLAGRAARARSVSLELAATQLEIAIAAGRAPDRPSTSDQPRRSPRAE